jgi:hypothetical protein
MGQGQGTERPISRHLKDIYFAEKKIVVAHDSIRAVRAVGPDTMATHRVSPRSARPIVWHAKAGESFATRSQARRHATISAISSMNVAISQAIRRDHELLAGPCGGAVR